MAWYLLIFSWHPWFFQDRSSVYLLPQSSLLRAHPTHSHKCSSLCDKLYGYPTQIPYTHFKTRMVQNWTHHLLLKIWSSSCTCYTDKWQHHLYTRQSQRSQMGQGERKQDHFQVIQFYSLYLWVKHLFSIPTTTILVHITITSYPADYKSPLTSFHLNSWLPCPTIYHSTEI